MSKFSTPFLKKSPLQGAYENAADGGAFMGGLVSGQEQFAKLQQDIIKGFDNVLEGDGAQQRLQEKSQKRIDEMEENSPEQKRAQDAHNKRFNTKGSVECPQGETLEPISVNGQIIYKCM